MSGLTVGNEYKVVSDRKGTFFGRLTRFDDTWASVVITQGKAGARLKYNEVYTGEEVTVRRSFCTFTEQEASHGNQ